MGSETLPSACYILSDKCSIRFYSTIPFHMVLVNNQLVYIIFSRYDNRAPGTLLDGKGIVNAPVYAHFLWV